MKEINYLYPEKLIRVYRIITLVKEKRMKQKQAVKELNLSTRQIRNLVKRLRQSNGSIESLRYQRNHHAWNRTPDPIRDKVAKLKQQRKKRSCQHIAELRIHPMRKIRVFPNGKFVQEFKYKQKP